MTLMILIYLGGNLMRFLFREWKYLEGRWELDDTYDSYLESGST